MYIDPNADDPVGPTRMSVDPDKLMQLKKGLEDERDRIRDWLFSNRERLETIEPPGSDPCSRDAMDLMGQSGLTAVDKGAAYVERLTAIAHKMQESVTTYQLIEDDTTAEFRRGPA